MPPAAYSRHAPNSASTSAPTAAPAAPRSPLARAGCTRRSAARRRARSARGCRPGTRITRKSKNCASAHAFFCTVSRARPRSRRCQARNRSASAGLRRPHRAAHEPDELEDHRPVPGHRGVARSRRPPPPAGTGRPAPARSPPAPAAVASRARGIQRPHHRKAHHCSRSPRPTVRPDWRQSFSNPDELSSIRPVPACRSWPGQTRHQEQPDDHEPRKVPISDPAEIARMQAGQPGAPGPAWPGPDGAAEEDQEDMLP